MLTILKKHQIDAVLPTMGGQTALNLCIEASEKGIWEEFKVEIIGVDCSNYSINAQDRNGKHWALYLSTKKYHLSIFNSGKVDSRLSGKDIHIIKQNKNKIIKVASLIIRVIIGRYDIILNAKKK